MCYTKIDIIIYSISIRIGLIAYQIGSIAITTALLQLQRLYYKWNGMGTTYIAIRRGSLSIRPSSLTWKELTLLQLEQGLCCWNGPYYNQNVFYCNYNWIYCSLIGSTTIRMNHVKIGTDSIFVLVIN